jgi:hypothetical protein
MPDAAAGRAVIAIDPDARGRREPVGGRVGAADGTAADPTSPRLWPVAVATDLGRVAHVSDETDLTSADGAASADQAAAVEAAMADARARLAEVPASVVVTNHVMGLYELAAIHLSAEVPDLVAASLAIDSMALLVDGLGDRLGDDAPTMRDALANIRMAYVGITARAGRSAPDDEESSPTGA